MWIIIIMLSFRNEVHLLEKYSLEKVLFCACNLSRDRPQLMIKDEKNLNYVRKKSLILKCFVRRSLYGEIKKKEIL